MRVEGLWGRCRGKELDSGVICEIECNCARGIDLCYVRVCFFAFTTTTTTTATATTLITLITFFCVDNSASHLLKQISIRFCVQETG